MRRSLADAEIATSIRLSDSIDGGMIGYKLGLNSPSFFNAQGRNVPPQMRQHRAKCRFEDAIGYQTDEADGAAFVNVGGGNPSTAPASRNHIARG